MLEMQLTIYLHRLEEMTPIAQSSCRARSHQWVNALFAFATGPEG
jgi:hypothetical protein